VAARDVRRGRFAGGGHHAASGPASFALADGNDVGISSYQLASEFSAGRHSHYGPFVAIVKSGVLDYYEGHGGECVRSGHYRAGDAYFGVPGPDHNHLLHVPEGGEVWAVYLNMPRTAAAVPAVGQQLDSIDFSKMPTCPRVR
jgi:hypothetical protein